MRWSIVERAHVLVSVQRHWRGRQFHCASNTQNRLSLLQHTISTSPFHHKKLLKNLAADHRCQFCRCESINTAIMATEAPLNYEASAGMNNLQVSNTLPSEVVQCLQNARFVSPLPPIPFAPPPPLPEKSCSRRSC